MKFSFKIQQYQTDAVDAVARVFQGQPYNAGVSYLRDMGSLSAQPQQLSLVSSGDDATQVELLDLINDSGFKNEALQLTDQELLQNIRALQAEANIHQSDKLVAPLGRCSLDIEMETGTGKTTLSTDPKRLLIGDDEHGWDDNGVFNFEGGCYAKVINLDKDSEPDIYNAITRDALLENVTLDKDGKIDFADKSVTENTRVSYPINHIKNIVRPVSAAPAAKNVIFLSADAFGVLPPVSILTPEQTQYYFLSGFTAKLAGTERGITEPTPTFSACFGQAFLELHPTKYGEELVKKMKANGAKAYLVNTGWNGTGKRITIKDTRGIIDAILSGDILKAPTKKIPYFDFEVPTELPGVDSKILDPRDTYADASEWENKAKDLASRFEKNFVKYTGNDAGKALVEAGPHA